jgi:uncharacterized protein YxjI
VSKKPRFAATSFEEKKMNYPLTLSFKIVAIAPQITVTDAAGNVVAYVKQKAFKLKEAVTVFADTGQTRPLYTINADRVIDFSATYHFADMTGHSLGAIKRQGMKSLWKAHYEIMDGGGPALTIREENGWVKVVDALVGEVPILGIFTGYLFNPKYIMTRADGSPVLRLTKQPAFFEGRFTIEPLGPIAPHEETRALLGVLMMTLLERARG